MYIISSEKNGTVRFKPDIGTITEESVSRSSTITDNPVEGGSNIQDHVFCSPQNFSASGIVVGGMAAIEQLERIWKSGDICSYTGRIRRENLVIQTFSTKLSAGNKDGASFSLTFKQITFASAEYVAMGSEPLMSQQDAAASQKSSGSGSSSGTKKNQTSATKSDGLTTTAYQAISSSSYAKYVATFNSKSVSSVQSKTPANSGTGR